MTDSKTDPQAFESHDGAKLMERPLIDHTVTKDLENGKPFLSLTVSNPSPQGSLPVYIGNSLPVQGHVELDLEKELSVSSIVVSLEGLFSNTDIDQTNYAIHYETFMKVEETIWTAEGDKSSSEHKSPLSFLTNHGGPKTHLKGHHSWPFSLSLPETITFTEKEAKALDIGVAPNVHYKLPPFLREGDFDASLKYSVKATVKCGGFMDTDQSVQIFLGYIPNVPAESLHYNGELSWTTFSDIAFSGTLGGGDIEVACRLDIPSPASYRRGSTVPLVLTISSIEEEALDLFSQSDCPVVQLHEQIKFRSGAKNAVEATISSVNQDEKLPHATATWSPSQEVPGGNANERVLQGEIHVPAKLTPSFEFGEFELKYYLDVFPFRATGFKPLSDKRVFRSSEVTITAV